jgi:hypothetical protein
MHDRLTQRTLRKPKAAPEIRRCHRCNGLGTAACRICGGSGKLMRGADANGHPRFDTCEGCLGRKTTRCPTCHGQLFI